MNTQPQNIRAIAAPNPSQPAQAHTAGPSRQPNGRVGLYGCDHLMQPITSEEADRIAAETFAAMGVTPEREAEMLDVVIDRLIADLDLDHEQHIAEQHDRALGLIAARHLERRAIWWIAGGLIFTAAFLYIVQDFYL